MNGALSEIDVKILAARAAKREKYLLVLKSSRQSSFVAILAATLLAIVVVEVGLVGLQLPFWSKLIVGCACILSFASVAFAWKIQRQLSAAIDLLLLNEDQKY